LTSRVFVAILRLNCPDLEQDVRMEEETERLDAQNALTFQ